MCKAKFLFDSNSFISAKNTFYGFDIAPSFWEQLNELAAKETLGIIDRVYDELVFPNDPDKEDELSRWIRIEFQGKVHTTKETQVVQMYARIIQKMTQDAPYATSYSKSAKARFAEVNNADAWQVAFAQVNNLTIVTFETYTPDERKNIKIPVVCKEFGVHYINLHEFMRRVSMKL